MSGGRFDVCIDTVLKYEVGSLWKTGGYTNYPADPGGETKWGISKRAHPNVDIKNLTLEGAKEIYFREYWTRTGCFSFPAPFDLIVLDAAVHTGQMSAIRQAQRALGVKDDGINGGETQRAAARIRPGVDTAAQTRALIARFLVERCEAMRLAPAAPTYFKGWMTRCFDLHEIALEEAA